MSAPVYPLIYTLGPAGTYSEEAARQIIGSESRLIYGKTFADTLQQAKSQPQAVAVVPIENSVAGIVAQVQDSLVSENFVILAELNLPIRHALVSNAPLEQVALYYAHPQAYDQCAGFAARLAQATVEFTHSNAESGLFFLKALEAQRPVAAIVPVSFAEKHSAWIHALDIQDYANNTTRFLVVRARRPQERFDFHQEKTSLFIEFSEDRPGLLYELLGLFDRFQINLCRLESRPSKHIPWFYVFYVDFNNNGCTEECLNALDQSSFHYRVLGSYSLLK